MNYRHNLSLLLLPCLFFLGCSGSETANDTKTDPVEKEKSETKKNTNSNKTPPPLKVTADEYPDVASGVAALVKATNDREAQDAQRATMWLQMQKEASVEPLSAVLLDASADPRVHLAAVRALGGCGPTAEMAIRETVESHSNKIIQRNAILQLGEIKPTNPKLVADLLAMAKSEDHSRRRAGLNALEAIGEPAGDAVAEELLAISKSDAPEDIRAAAAAALKAVNPRKTFKD